MACAGVKANAPRAVRTADDLWGLPQLRLLEFDQIGIGNLLLCFTAEAFLRLAGRRGIAAVEHPKEPEEPDLASIWKLPLIRALCELPGAELLTLSQGLLGAPSCTPTGLLCLNLPGMCHAVARHRVTPDVPRGSSIGLDRSGQWATSALKEYPPAFSRALAS